MLDAGKKTALIPLTDVDIQADLCAAIRGRMIERICFYLFTMLGAGLMAWVTALARLVSVVRWPLYGIAFGAGVVLIYRLTVLYLLYRSARRGEYCVLRQTLVNTGAERIWEPDLSIQGKIRLTKSVFCLYFKSQEWRVPGAPYSAWCGEFRPGAGRSARETFVIGDTFYVVLLKRNYEIWSAYNTNFFAYNGTVSE